MNKTEERYARQVLEPRRMAGELVAYRFEAFTLRFGKGCTWTPDYYVLHSDMAVELIDVKGTRKGDEQAQRFKIRLAAQEWPEFLFSIAREQRGGGWAREEIT